MNEISISCYTPLSALGLDFEVPAAEDVDNKSRLVFLIKYFLEQYWAVEVWVLPGGHTTGAVRDLIRGTGHHFGGGGSAPPPPPKRFGQILLPGLPPIKTFLWRLRRQLVQTSNFLRLLWRLQKVSTTGRGGGDHGFLSYANSAIVDREVQ